MFSKTQQDFTWLQRRRLDLTCMFLTTSEWFVSLAYRIDPTTEKVGA